MAATLTDTLIELGLRRLLDARLVREIPVASPAAGAEISAVVPSGTFWEILSVFSLLTTSAVVASRRPVLNVSDADGNRVARAPVNLSVTQSQAFQIGWTATAGAQLTSSGSIGVAPTPMQYALPSWTITTVTSGLDVGDQWSAVVLLVRELSADQIAKQSRWVGRNLGTDVIYQGAV